MTFIEKKTVIERRYLKIQEMLANVGRIFKIILLVSSFICTIVSQNLFYKNMINKKNISLKDYQNQFSPLNHFEAENLSLLRKLSKIIL